MDFFTLLKSLDKLLYELVSWLVFYPLTLWRSLRHPLDMMDYADTELEDSADEQYTDTLSPPLFLLISLIISHAAEIAMVGQNSLVTNTRGLAGFISSDTNLIVFRIVMFSFFPLAMAVRVLRHQGKALNRTSLKPPFYSQCYAAAPFALLTGLAALAIDSRSGGAVLWGLAALACVFLWYGTIQVLWFSHHLGVGKARAFVHASIGIVNGLIATAIVGWLVA